MRASEFTGVIFCEDIRREITEKLIFIGVYTGEVVVPAFPSPIQLAVWAEIGNMPIGKRTIELRIGIENKGWLNAQIQLEATAEGPVSFVIPPMQILVEESSDFELQVQNGKEFETVRKKRIIAGPTKDPFNLYAIGQEPPS
jgi:hypothetical protein